MSKNLMGNIVYLTNAEYDTLITTGTVTLGSGEAITYSENDTYITPEENATATNAGLMSHMDKAKLDGIASGATNVVESTVSGWGFTKNSGTITGIKMNGSSKGTSGVVDLGTVITSHQDISGKADKASGLTGATKCKITYNSSGIVTGGSDLSATDIPSLSADKITSGTLPDARIASASTWNGKYTKPSAGIPASDLASGVIPDISVKQDKLAVTGSATKPIYVSAAGVVSAGNTYAGGTAVTLNGTSKASTTASFYAPTSQLANSDSKVYLVGATSGTSLTTVKSNSEVYMESGYLHSLGLDGNILTLGSTDTEYLSLYGTSVLINNKPVTTKESRQVTLSSTTWNNNQQTVSCEGMSATADAVISPAPSSMSDVISSKIYASAQGSGTITFTCDEVPTNNVVFNIMIMS